MYLIIDFKKISNYTSLTKSVWIWLAYFCGSLGFEGLQYNVQYGRKKRDDCGRLTLLEVCCVGALTVKRVYWAGIKNKLLLGDAFVAFGSYLGIEVANDLPKELETKVAALL